MPGGRGSAPDLDLKMTPVGARSRAPTGVIVFPGVSKGAQPLPPPEAFFLLLLNVYATVACRRRLQKAPRRIHERLPRTYSRPAQGLGQRPQARLGHARSRQRQSPRPGLAESGCAQEKAELYLFREGREDASGGRGLSPRPRPGKHDACWRAKPRANRRHCFPQGFPKGLSSLAAGGILPLCFNVYATVACRRRLQKAPSSNP